MYYDMFRVHVELFVCYFSWFFEIHFLSFFFLLFLYHSLKKIVFFYINWFSTDTCISWFFFTPFRLTPTLPYWMNFFCWRRKKKWPVFAEINIYSQSCRDSLSREDLSSFESFEVWLVWFKIWIYKLYYCPL